LNQAKPRVSPTGPQKTRIALIQGSLVSDKLLQIKHRKRQQNMNDPSGLGAYDEET